MEGNQESARGNRPSLASTKRDFSSENLTPFGGMYVLRKEMERFALSDKVNKLFLVFNFRKEHRIGDLFEQIMVSMISGRTCINDTKLLDDDYLKGLALCLTL